MTPLAAITNKAQLFRRQVLQEPLVLSEAEQITDSIEKTRQELERAEADFNELTDSSAVDFAAYNLLAVRAKYSYLIKLAKEKNISL